MDRKTKDIPNLKASASDTTKEKCVICHAETEYTCNIHISERQFYIESVGQLCPKCYHDLYMKNSR